MPLTVYSIQDFICTELGHQLLKTPSIKPDVNADERQILSLIAQYHDSNLQQKKQLIQQFDSLYEQVNLTRLVILKLLEFEGVPHAHQSMIEQDKLVNLGAALAVLANYSPQSGSTVAKLSAAYPNFTKTNMRSANSIYSDDAVSSHSIIHAINALSAQSNAESDDEPDHAPTSLADELDAIADILNTMTSVSNPNEANVEILPDDANTDDLQQDAPTVADTQQTKAHTLAKTTQNSHSPSKTDAHSDSDTQADTHKTNKDTDVDPMLRFVAEFTKDS